MADVTTRYLVAPNIADGSLNTLRQPFLPQACWRMEDHQFDFGSSFLLPECRTEFAALARVRPANAENGLLISIFGHADATGDDAANKRLSGRRALALYALLIRDTAAWEKLFGEPVGSDKWGTRHVQVMLNGLGYECPVTGKEDDALKQALTKFQEKSVIARSGQSDVPTRSKLFTAYMDLLCVDAKGAAFRYAPEDFLGRGVDPGGKGAYQGCGEFNPTLVLSKKRSDALQSNAAERELANRGNRRVLVYLFEPALRFDLQKWPCPRASEGDAGCRKMFWSNGDKRRAPGPKERESRKDGETFACRWYDGLARYQPCEGARKTVTVFLLDHQHLRMPGAYFRACVGASTFEARADADGRATLSNVLPPGTCTLEWGGAKGKYRYYAELSLTFDEEAPHDDANEVTQRLANLGYKKPTLAENFADYQRDYGLEKKPFPDSTTLTSLWSTHALGKEGKPPPKAAEEPEQPVQFEPLPLHSTEGVPIDETDAIVVDTSGHHEPDQLDEWQRRRAAQVDEAIKDS